MGVFLAKVLERPKSVRAKGVLLSVGQLGVWLVYTGLCIHIAIFGFLLWYLIMLMI